MLPVNRNIIQEVALLPSYWLALWRGNRQITAGEKVIYGSHPRQHFRYYPANGPTKMVLVYFHGGGWQFGSPYHFRVLARLFNPMGIGLVLPAYRGLVSTNYRGMKADLQAFYTHLANFMQSQKLEHRQIIIGGMSAGGHLAALSALDPEISLGVKEVKGLFLSGAVLNLDEMPDSILLRRLAGRRGQGLWQEANPFSYLDQHPLPPCLIMHGTQDGMVPFRSMASFYDKASNIPGSSVQMHILENGSHLDVGRWMYREDPQRQVVEKFVTQCLAN